MKHVAVTLGIILACILMMLFPLASAFTIGVFANEILGLPFIGSCVFGLIITYLSIFIDFALLLVDDMS